jgi:hypothetical protein
MYFDKALKMLLDYKEMTRDCDEWNKQQSSLGYNEWTNELEYNYHENNSPIICKWIPTQTDILASDWIEI